MRTHALRSSLTLGFAWLFALTLSACGTAEPDASSGSEASTDATVSVREVSQDEALAIGGGEGAALFLDVRSTDEFASGHVPGALNISVDELKDRLGDLEASRDSEIIVYCERGGRANTATDMLMAAGFTNLGHLTGDMSAWRAAGLATE